MKIKAELLPRNALAEEPSLTNAALNCLNKQCFGYLFSNMSEMMEKHEITQWKTPLPSEIASYD